MTAIISPQGPDLDDCPPFPVRRWSLEEYHSLINQGMFEDERVELLEGWIVPKMTRNPPHDATVAIVDDLLRPMIGQTGHLRIQSAVSLEESEPEPDLAVVRGSARDYRQRHPGMGEILLVVEIADASLRKDRRKATIYAAAGIPVYWIVNLGEQQVEVYSDPDPMTQTYRQLSTRGMGTGVPVSFSERQASLRVEEIFPQD